MSGRWAAAGGRWSDVWEVGCCWREMERCLGGGLLLEGDGVMSGRWAAAGGRWSDVWEVGCCWREME